MGGKASQRLGAWGERLVAKTFGYRVEPGSGNRWPRKQDLVDVRGHRVAQVKTTTARALLDEWTALERFARAEKAAPYYYIVVRGGGLAHIFSVAKVKTVLLGVGGDER